MRAIVIDQPGGPEVLHIGEVPSPRLEANEIRIEVHATAVNRADLLQREGHYPPPAGASPILGLECAGIVTEVGSGTNGWSRGERVMALLAGGGYAEEVVVDAGSAMHLPETLAFEQAGAIPEVFLTAFSNIFMLAHARPGESILVHGGGSGVGTAATTLCKLAGMRVLVTAGSPETCAKCLEHGPTGHQLPQRGLRRESARSRHRPRSPRRDVPDARSRRARRRGRVVIIGSMGGIRTTELDVSKLLGKRQQIIGSTLRARPLAEKASIVAAFIDRFGNDLAAGRIRPVIDSVFPLEHADDAHRQMDSDHFGKIVLKVR